MITQQDLKQAIAECQGERNPNANTCIKLAAFLTIHRELFGEEKQAEQLPSYSFAPAPDRNIINFDSDSEFARAINGRDVNEILPIIEELAETLEVIQPRLYNAFINKLV